MGHWPSHVAMEDPPSDLKASHRTAEEGMGKGPLTSKCAQGTKPFAQALLWTVLPWCCWDWKAPGRVGPRQQVVESINYNWEEIWPIPQMEAGAGMVAGHHPHSWPEHLSFFMLCFSESRCLEAADPGALPRDTTTASLPPGSLYLRTGRWQERLSEPSCSSPTSSYIIRSHFSQSVPSFPFQSMGCCV
jgi:hypothetical protein